MFDYRMIEPIVVSALDSLRGRSRQSDAPWRNRAGDPVLHPAKAASEPSMEDILGSIRKIIADDAGETGAGPGKQPLPPRPDSGGKRKPGEPVRDFGLKPDPVTLLRMQLKLMDEKLDKALTEAAQVPGLRAQVAERDRKLAEARPDPELVAQLSELTRQRDEARAQAAAVPGLRTEMAGLRQRADKAEAAKTAMEAELTRLRAGNRPPPPSGGAGFVEGLSRADRKLVQRALARVLHPDVQDGGAAGKSASEDLLKRLNAYLDTLARAERR